MTLIPGIKQISQVGNDMYAQGAFPVAIGTTNVNYLADPADTRLLAGRDPVLEEVSVGMSGVETEIKTIMSGTQPLVIPDAYYGNMTFLEVKFHPEQDYHGYSGPWPGGANVNLLIQNNSEQTYEENGLTVTLNTNGELVFNGQLSSGSSYFHLFTLDTPIEVDTSMYVHLFNEFVTSGCVIGIRQSNNTSISSSSTDTTNKVYQVTGSATMGGISVFVNSTANFENRTARPLIAKTNSVSSWSPYANLCPITGYSEIKVYIEPAYDAAATPKAVVQLGDTYYYGTIDLVSGFLAATHVMTVFNGSEGWSLYSGGGGKFQKTLIGTSYTVPGYDAATPLNQIRCSIVPNTTRHEVADGNLGICIVNTNVFAIFISSSITTEAQMKSYLAGLYAAGTPMQILSRMAAPQYIQIHGANNLLLQTGTNTVWTDTNENDISVAYVTEK